MRLNTVAGSLRYAFVLVLVIAICYLSKSAIAQDASPELVQPLVCSARTATDPGLKDVCSIKPLKGGHNQVRISLTAETSVVAVAGYQLITENYNASYLTPIVEAMPGDTVAAHLVNILQPRVHDGAPHGDGDQNPTNLHYFHGGIVSPNNARPGNAELGTGDNIYVHLKAGSTSDAQDTFDLTVPIPGRNALDARVLEKTGYISHPVGLNWYHSHLHGISSDQVMGGMSGLLSVGEATANVKAACQPSPKDKTKCSNDVDKDTADLRRRTEVRYVLLRDLPVKKIRYRPDEDVHSTAEWAPEARDFKDGTPCGAWDGSALNFNDAKLRRGFCQTTLDTARFYTLNGQRFPTITVKGGQNALLRIGNVSANIGYWLEMDKESDGSILDLTVVGLDGIVPVRPVSPNLASQPVQAFNLSDLLLMPASRVELYVRNDQTPHEDRQVYVLRTKRVRGIGSDEWPEIQLARIVLERNVVASKIASGLNALVATPAGPNPTGPFAAQFLPPAAAPVMPEGCVRDLDPSAHEFRRVTFLKDTSPTATASSSPKWRILTETVVPSGSGLTEEGDFPTADGTTISRTDGLGIPFEDYVGHDEHVDWTKPHVCIELNNTGSHKQLWVLFNSTDTLHNFHIHQMKFRLATKQELEETYHIHVPDPSNTCNAAPSQVLRPNYNCYDPVGVDVHDPGALPLWHDTIPMPPGSKVFVIMSFDDLKQQVGRYVFHCHILKHEDNGLMAPIEVWDPAAIVQTKPKGENK